jgi:hypothetical protein
MRRLPWPRRPAQGAALAIAVAATAVLAAAILSAVTWAGGAAPRPLAGVPRAASTPPAAPGPGQPPRASTLPAGQPGGQQEQGQLVAGTGYVAALPASAVAGGAPVVTLVIVSGAPSVTITAAPLGGTLVRAVTAGGYGARPVLDVVRGPATGGAPSTTIGVSLDPAGAAGGPPARAALALTVSSAVTWQLDFGGGTSQTSVNMTGGHVAGLAFGLGSASVQVALPRLDGTAVLRLEGGASQLAVSVPAGVPARVTAADGAARVALGASAWSGIAAGTVLAQPGWAAAAGRLDIDATSGVSQVTVTDR